MLEKWTQKQTHTLIFSAAHNRTSWSCPWSVNLCSSSFFAFPGFGIIVLTSKCCLLLSHACVRLSEWQCAKTSAHAWCCSSYKSGSLSSSPSAYILPLCLGHAFFAFHRFSIFYRMFHISATFFLFSFFLLVFIKILAVRWCSDLLVRREQCARECTC